MNAETLETLETYQRCYKFVRYEKVAFISDVEKTLLILVYAVDDPEGNMHIFNKLFCQTLAEQIPLERIKVIVYQLRALKH